MGWKPFENKIGRRVEVIWKIQKRRIALNSNGKRGRWITRKGEKRSDLKCKYLIFHGGWKSVRVTLSDDVLWRSWGKKKLTEFETKMNGTKKINRRRTLGINEKIKRRIRSKIITEKKRKRGKKRKLENAFIRRNGLKTNQKKRW